MAQFEVLKPRPNKVFSIADFSGIDKITNLPDKKRAVDAYNYKTDYGLIRKREGVKILWNRNRSDIGINVDTSTKLLDIFRISNELVLFVFEETEMDPLPIVRYKFYTSDSFSGTLTLSKILTSNVGTERAVTSKPYTRDFVKIKQGNVFAAFINLHWDDYSSSFSKNDFKLKIDPYASNSANIVSVLTPYIPDTLISLNPDGTAGTILEEINKLTPMCTHSFLGTADTVDYVLNTTDMTADDVIVKILSSEGVWETVDSDDYTVNRTTKTITFDTAPGVSPGFNSFGFNASV
jgi:hypothetical protein